MGGVVILASSEQYFIRVVENLVQYPVKIYRLERHYSNRQASHRLQFEEGVLNDKWQTMQDIFSIQDANYILAILDSRMKFVAHERFQYVLLKKFGKRIYYTSIMSDIL